MRWRYYIPHVWDSPEDRSLWEDVYLLPEDGRDGGKSYWFTLNALPMAAAGMQGEYPDDPDDPYGGICGSALDRQTNLRLLGDRDHFITPTLDMVARVDDFNMHELLEWTKVFIRDHFGDPKPELVQGNREDFAGTNPHASEIGRISEEIASGVPEEEVIDYRPGESNEPSA